MATIRAAVAIVFDIEQIAINVGADSGVAEGDKVQLLREVQVPDPTREGVFLGKAFIKKGTFVVDSVEEKFAVARVLKVRSPGNIFTSTYERQFSIVDSLSKEGEGRVYVKPLDPVDVIISDEDADAPE